MFKANASSIYLPLRCCNALELEQLRCVADNLADKIPAHITLVFPFSYSLIATRQGIFNRIKTIAAAVAPFSLELSPEVSTCSGVHYLKVVGDQAALNCLERLSRELYALLEGYGVAQPSSYIPHVTIGRYLFSVSEQEIVSQRMSLQSKWQKLSTSKLSFLVSEIELERITPEDDGIVEYRCPLRASD